MASMAKAGVRAAGRWRRRSGVGRSVEKAEWGRPVKMAPNARFRKSAGQKTSECMPPATFTPPPKQQKRSSAAVSASQAPFHAANPHATCWLNDQHFSNFTHSASLLHAPRAEAAHRAPHRMPRIARPVAYHASRVSPRIACHTSRCMAQRCPSFTGNRSQSAGLPRPRLIYLLSRRPVPSRRDGAGRTGLAARAAADALGAVGIRTHFDPHGTDAFARAAPYAAVLVDAHPIEAEPVEQPVQRPEGAQITAELPARARPPPGWQRARAASSRTAPLRPRADPRWKAAAGCPRRASPPDTGTRRTAASRPPRSSRAATAPRPCRTARHIQEAQRPVDATRHVKLARRNLVQQVLYQAERAEKPADEAPEENAEEHRGCPARRRGCGARPRRSRSGGRRSGTHRARPDTSSSSGPAGRPLWSDR